MRGLRFCFIGRRSDDPVSTVEIRSLGPRARGSVPVKKDIEHARRRIPRMLFNLHFETQETVAPFLAPDISTAPSTSVIPTDVKKQQLECKSTHQWRTKLY